MRSHPAKSIVGVTLLVALFARIPAAHAQVRGSYVPGVNTARSGPPEAGLTYAVIVVIPVAVTPLSAITFGKIAGRTPFAEAYFAPVVLGWRSDRQEAGRFRLSGITRTVYLTGKCQPAQPVPKECGSSSTNVVFSATIHF